MASNPSWLRSLGQALAKVAMPALGQVKKLSDFWRLFVWIAHAVLIIAIVCVLYYVGYRLQLDTSISYVSQTVAWGFFAILFLIGYAMLWIVIKLFGLGREIVDDPYPDITEAWEEAVRELQRANIDLSELPLFLLLGEPRGGASAFFENARWRPMASPAPARQGGGSPPLRVHAVKDSREDEGLFVTCQGASLLGRHARSGASPAGAPAPGAAPPDPAMTMQLGGGNEFAAVNAIIEQTGKRPLTMQEVGYLEQSVAFMPQILAPVVRDPVLARHLTARLRHLCQLISRDRAPRCPANGILLLVPLTGVGDPIKDPQNGPQVALDTGIVCRADLAAVCDVFQMHVPTVALLCDLESLPGGKSYLTCFSPDELLQRRGSSFPLLPRFLPQTGVRNEHHMAGAINSVVDWICDTVAFERIRTPKGFRIEAADGGSPDLASVEKHNGQLFQFFDAIHARKSGIASVLREVFASETKKVSLPLYFAGLYLGWTGKSPEEFGFCAGVLSKMIQEQNHVRYTDQLRQDDERYRRKAEYARAAAFVLFLIDVGLFAYVVYRIIDWFRNNYV